MEFQQVMIYQGSEEKPYDFISKFNNVHRVGISKLIVLQDLISQETFTFKIPTKKQIDFSTLVLKKEYVCYFDFTSNTKQYNTLTFNRIEPSVF